jgi:hypothetical protein
MGGGVLDSSDLLCKMAFILCSIANRDRRFCCITKQTPNTFTIKREINLPLSSKCQFDGTLSFAESVKSQTTIVITNKLAASC